MRQLEPAPLSLQPEERALRARLGIPDGARQVLLLCESSHWDTNWLQTSGEYFTARVEPILHKVLAALEAEPRRVYCIESLFFLKRFWEHHPAARDRVRALFARGQLKLLSSAFTTPDTLLPHPETLLRDFELGHAWLEDEGLPTTCSTAYFPDNFGHSPHLPSLMKAVGVGAVGLTRIDGMYFVGSDWERRHSFPRPASTAELLEKVHRSHAFVWRDESGAEVLCHWNAHTYFMGDMLAHKGVIRWAGQVFAVPWRTSGHVARRLEGYARKLAPFSRTPYLLCPIGMDFNDPIDGLQALVERYGRERSATSGLHVAVAGLDDYFALQGFHRAALPVLEADPNPYWMGFLATRPEVKQRPVRIARRLLLAETLAAAAPLDASLQAELRGGWSTLVLSNHHDYIPGTSPDRVWHAEQRPWLDAAEASADRALERAASKHPCPPLAAPRPRGAGAHPGAVRVDAPRGRDRVHIATPHLSLELSRGRGGCLTSLRTSAGEHLGGLGFDLVAFHDEGGLWRLGHEFKGGRFEEAERASTHPARVELEDSPDEVRVRITSLLQGERFVRTLTCRAAEPLIRLHVCGRAPPRRTFTCRFETALRPHALEMDTLGGVIQRPRERLFSPTFWPVPSRLTLRDRLSLHALFESPTAAAVDARGGVEWIVARNALKERAWRWLPVLAHPIGGTNDDLQEHAAALSLDALSPRADLLAWDPAGHHPARALAVSLVGCDTAGVEVRALKHRQRGDGLTLRLYCERLPPEPVRIWLQGASVEEAWLCDALERSLQPLALDAERRVVVPLAGRLTSVRLRTRP